MSDFISEQKTCPFLTAGQLDDRWITNGPTSEQEVEISVLLLHAINLSL